MTETTTRAQVFAKHQILSMHRLERELGLKVNLSDDMLALVRRYAQLSETGYVQRPFMLERPTGVPGPHFWVSLQDGPDTVALAGLRVMENGDEAQSCADFFAAGGLYPNLGSRPEDYLPGAGPWLAPGARFAYLGAGWVHPRWRGQGLAGWLARIVNDEAALRAQGQIAFVCAMTFEPMYRAGLNLRANCWHHMQAGLVLDGYLAALDRELRMYLSHSTLAQQAALYAQELPYLQCGQTVPWLRPHDTTAAPELLRERADVVAA